MDRYGGDVAANKPADGNADGRSDDVVPAKPRFGAGALIISFLAAQFLALIGYSIARAVTNFDFKVPPGVGAAVGQATQQVSSGEAFAIGVPPPIWLTTLLQLPLWFGLAVLPLWFVTNRGRGAVAELKLKMKGMDVPLGLAIGVASQFILVPLVYLILRPLIGVQDISAEARNLTDRATGPISVILVFVVVGVCAPLAEEIYFRGFAQSIFARRLSVRWAVFASAAFFAATHFQVLQFPALLAFGVVLGFLVVRFDRLGPAIWAHIGFNMAAAVSLLFLT